MTRKTSTVAFILLASLTVPDFARIRPDKAEERGKFEKQPLLAAPHNKGCTTTSVTEDKMDKASEGEAASSAEADSAGAPFVAFESPAALVSQGSVLSPTFNVTGVLPEKPPSRKRKVQSTKAPPSIFSKMLDYVKTAHWSSRVPIMKAACDSIAFSCDEIIQLATSAEEAMLFVEGRNKNGCIVDPANAKSIRDSIESRYPSDWRARGLLRELDQAFIDNQGLKPAECVGPVPMRLQMGLRTDEDMEKLLVDMKKLQLIKAYGSEGAKGLYKPGSPSVEEFERWLQQMRVQGEQFSGPQLVTLVESIPTAPLARGYYRNSGTTHAVSVLLQYLEQYVTGVTCQEVNRIVKWMISFGAWQHNFAAGFHALKSNILDGPNKVDIVAFRNSPHHFIVPGMETALRDVGVGLPPTNNPIFGVVKGNPVIFVVDESRFMDSNFTFGDNTLPRRKFCNNQLEVVLEGLPNGTYFNVVQYSSSAVKIFPKAVPVSKTSIDAAMEAMGTTWRSDYTPAQDPVQWLRSIKVFTRKFRSTEVNSMTALQLAYADSAAADLPSQQPDDGQHTLHDHGELGVTRDSTQIYFLTSGQPAGGARQILDNIDEFDKGRNIPVNSVGFIMPADPAAKQFVKALARKTGGFFRSIEQASLKTNKKKVEPTESDVREPAASDSGNPQKRARAL